MNSIHWFRDWFMSKFASKNPRFQAFLGLIPRVFISCRRWELNPHECYLTRTWTVRVCHSATSANLNTIAFLFFSVKRDEIKNEMGKNEKVNSTAKWNDLSFLVSFLEKFLDFLFLLMILLFNIVFFYFFYKMILELFYIDL